MFQNISEQETINNNDEQIESKKKFSIKQLLKNMLTIPNIIIYVVSFMISTVSILDGMAVFAIAIFAAACSNGMVAGLVYVSTLAGTFVGLGKEAFLNYLLTSLFFMVLMLLVKPRIQEETKNEKMLLGKHLIFAVICLQAINLFTGTYLIADLLITIMQAILTYIFYKIFVNSIPVLQDIGSKKAFTIEEVIGASLLVSIAISATSNVNLFGISISNILSILLVLVLGWKNGILVGATTGLTIGVVLAIIGVGDNGIIATYALSGMIAGILNKFGRIGVIVGFAIGSGILIYTTNSNIETGVYIKELLIASIGLLLMPKSIEINIKDIVPETKLLPGTMANVLSAGKQTIYKLNSVSDAISEMAKSYEEAAATIVDEEADNIKRNKKIFIDEMLTNLETISDNILYDDLINEENGILDDIFEVLIEKEELEREDLIKIFENHNSYIVGADGEEISQAMENSLFQVLKNINYTYKISKINFVWKQKEIADKKNMSNKLNVVSKVISNLADEIEQDNKLRQDEEEEIRVLAKQKDIELEDVLINKQKNGKYIAKLKSIPKNNSVIMIMENIISKVLNSKMKYAGKEEKYSRYESEDKFKLEIGISRTTKSNSEISGDSSIQTKLKDGKYLLAISDGMGTGQAAKNSSKRVINMLENLLTSGFEKDTSIELINTAMTANVSDDMYATIDAVILDMYNGNVEFIKNGACSTYIKTKEGVQIIKDASIPVGMSNSVKSVTYDKDLEEGDMVLICSDGVQDSGEENWLKNILEKLQTENVQKIADIIIKESIDNNFGIAKDDMTIIIARVRK